MPIKGSVSEFHIQYLFIASDSPPGTWYSNEQCITTLPAFSPCVGEDLRKGNVVSASTNCTLELPNNKILFLNKV